MSKKTSEIEARIAAERNASKLFNDFVQLCTDALDAWVKKVNLFNNACTTTPKRPVYSYSICAKVSVPAIPISPIQTSLLLEYLKEVYLNNQNGKPFIGGDYFTIRKRLFKDEYKLATKYSSCCSDDDDFF